MLDKWKTKFLQIQGNICCVFKIWHFIRLVLPISISDFKQVNPRNYTRHQAKPLLCDLSLKFCKTFSVVNMQTDIHICLIFFNAQHWLFNQYINTKNLKLGINTVLMEHL